MSRDVADAVGGAKLELQWSAAFNVIERLLLDFVQVGNTRLWCPLSSFGRLTGLFDGRHTTRLVPGMMPFLRNL